LCVTIHHREG